MRRYKFSMLLLILLTTFACGGGNQKKDPVTVHPATKQLQRGVAWYQRGCFQKSLDAFTKAHELFSAADRLPDVAMSLNNIGNIYRHIGDTPSALLFFQEAYELYTHLDNHEGSIQALANQSAVLLSENRLDEAAAFIREAKNLAELSSSISVQTLNNQGILLTRRGQLDEAASVLQKAFQATTPEEIHLRATVLSSLGNLMSQKSEYRKALSHYQEALELDRQAEFYPGIADNLSAIGRVYYQLKEYRLATTHYKRSLKISAILGNSKQVSQTMMRLEDAAAKAEMDTTLTQHFVDKWSQGDISKHPCQ